METICLDTNYAAGFKVKQPEAALLLWIPQAKPTGPRGQV